MNVLSFIMREEGMSQRPPGRASACFMKFVKSLHIP